MLVNSGRWQAGGKWWRISKEFQSPFGHAFARSGYFPQAETGFYAALSGKPLPALQLDGYWLLRNDLWRTWNTPLPANSREAFVQAKLKLSTGGELSLRWQQNRNEDFLQSADRRFETRRQRWRLQYRHRMNSHLFITSRIEKVYYRSGNDGQRTGFSFYEDISWQAADNFHLSARFSSFKTEDFNSRIYEYEADVPGSFSNIANYGNGVKAYFRIRWNFFRNLTLYFKYRWLRYDGVTSIGSGDNEIEEDTRQDIHALLNYSF